MMSKLPFKPNSLLMQWAAKVGYQPPETADSIADEIEELEDEMFRIQSQIEDLENEYEETYERVRRLEALKEKVEDEEWQKRKPEAIPILLCIRPEGAADDQ